MQNWTSDMGTHHFLSLSWPQDQLYYHSVFIMLQVFLPDDNHLILIVNAGFSQGEGSKIYTVRVNMETDFNEPFMF
jgi:hypothetical protein